MVELRIEPLNYLLENGLPELSYLCWQQVGSGPAASEYAPDWSIYRNMEIGNSLRFFAMRDEDKLIGYASVTIGDDAHNSGLKNALILDFYVGEKKSGYAVKLIRYIEKIMLELRVDCLTVAEQLNVKQERGGVGKFYLFMGFEPQQINWTKRLGKDGSA